jgi:hypothetical protein
VDLEDVEPVTDLSPANWLIRGATGFEGRVRDVVPATYDVFARVISEENLPLPQLRMCWPGTPERTGAGLPSGTAGRRCSIVLGFVTARHTGLQLVDRVNTVARKRQWTNSSHGVEWGGCHRPN